MLRFWRQLAITIHQNLPETWQESQSWPALYHLNIYAAYELPITFDPLLSHALPCAPGVLWFKDVEPSLWPDMTLATRWAVAPLVPWWRPRIESQMLREPGKLWRKATLMNSLCLQWSNCILNWYSNLYWAYVGLHSYYRVHTYLDSMTGRSWGQRFWGKEQQIRSTEARTTTRCSEGKPSQCPSWTIPTFASWNWNERDRIFMLFLTSWAFPSSFRIFSPDNLVRH